MARREFSKAVKVEIIKRATRDGQPYCEKCSNPTKGRFEIHHLREDALEIDKSRKLAAEDGALWCEPCHSEHTAKFSVPAVATAKRAEAAAIGAHKPNKQKIQQPPKDRKSTFKQDQIAALREGQYRARYGSAE